MYIYMNVLHMYIYEYVCMCITACVCVCVGVSELACVRFVARQEIDGPAPTPGELLTHNTLAKCRWLPDA